MWVGSAVASVQVTVGGLGEARGRLVDKGWVIYRLVVRPDEDGVISAVEAKPKEG